MLKSHMVCSIVNGPNTWDPAFIWESEDTHGFALAKHWLAMVSIWGMNQ